MEDSVCLTVYTKFRIPPVLHEKIPNAKEIIGFRNIISHGYDVVSDQ